MACAGDAGGLARAGWDWRTWLAGAPGNFSLVGASIRPALAANSSQSADMGPRLTSSTDGEGGRVLGSPGIEHGLHVKTVRSPLAYPKPRVRQRECPPSHLSLPQSPPIRHGCHIGSIGRAGGCSSSNWRAHRWARRGFWPTANRRDPMAKHGSRLRRSYPCRSIADRSISCSTPLSAAPPCLRARSIGRGRSRRLTNPIFSPHWPERAWRRADRAHRCWPPS